MGAEEAEARAYLAELRGRRVRHAALQEEIDSLQAFVDVYDQVRTANSAATGGRAAAREREAAAERARQAERAREAAKEEAERERVRAARGMFGRAILGPRARKLVSEMFGKECICMALSGDSDDVLVAHEKGTMGFTPGIPRAVSDLLGGLHDHHPRPTFVTFGSQGRYYIQFENGKSEWLGPDGLSESLKENYSRSVASVAFGRGWNSYFVVYADGYWSCSDLPRELAGVIASRGNTDDLKHVNLGPNGEYFLEAHDGSMFWGGCAEEVMGEAESVRGRVVEILFGSNSTCMVRYS